MTGPIRDDRSMNAAIRSWLTENREPALDRGRQIGRIMDRVDEVGQRRRRWWLDPFGRRAAHAAATGTDEAVDHARGRTGVLVPAGALAAVALVLVVAMSLVWAASRPLEQRMVPASWAVNPADEALFEGFVKLWTGDATDLATTRQVYAEDAALRVLWLDHEEVISGSDAIWMHMRGSASADYTKVGLIPLPDHFSGAHLYLLVPASPDATALAGAACVLWIEDERIERHDCIEPRSFENDAQPRLVAPDPSKSAERKALADAFTAAIAAHDSLEAFVSPEVAHHVLSTNQMYTLEGITEYRSVMSLGGPNAIADADLPAPEGEIRWANFSDLGSGTLCVFRARDGLIIRHDCILPSTSTVSESLTEIRKPPQT
jgi:hypothetical protein